MNPLQKYEDTGTAISCSTFKECQEINKLIVELGGRDLTKVGWDAYGTNVSFCMEAVSTKRNCYYKTDWYRDGGYIIVPASQILQPPQNIFN